jgi:ribosomal protein S18 acetylase RimI-like enzyme
MFYASRDNLLGQLTCAGRILMEMREAKPSDVSRLKSLWSEFMDFHSNLDPDYIRSEDALVNWADYIHSKLEDDSAAVFVATEDKAVVGYIGAMVRQYPPVYTLKKYGFIEEIAITREFRRRGIASQLFRVAEEWLLAQGVNRIKVNIDVANKASQGFFRSQGFIDSTETLMKKHRA